MEKDEHKKRHKILHSHLDELVADYIHHNPDGLPSKTSVMELIRWSHEQRVTPSGN